MSMVNFRPNNFAEFKGKEHIKNNLNIFIQSSIKNQQILDHVLLYGLPGTGKTSIAFIIANTLNKKIKVVQGTQIKRIADLMNFMSLITEGDVLFIDEIHAIGEECFETLYSILEDHAIDIKIGKEHNIKYTRVNMPNFTLIGATTNISKIPKPLEERFGISFYFDLYNDDEIIEIINATAQKINLSFTQKEIELICHHCKGTPRLANKLIKRINDYKNIHPHLSIDEILKSIGIYELGLEQMDVIYLKSFMQGSYLGLKTISSITQIDEYTIENRIEPFLIKNNFIMKTCKGRSLTYEGEKLLEKLSKNN